MRLLGAGRLRVLVAALSTIALLVGVGAGGAEIAGATSLSPPSQCRDVNLAVGLAEGADPIYEVTGALCGKPAVAQRVLHVLLSGATYSRIYWDFPMQPERYSYVQALTSAGVSTFALDRIGIGASGHPPGDEVTMQAGALVVHQVVQALRDGRLGRFDTIVLVGHSLGSGTALLEAAAYQDVDGLILTGFLHNVGPKFGAVPAIVHPVEEDPQLAGRGLPPGYLTTRPDTRGVFYWGPGADPNVIALDEATKDTVTTGERDTFPPEVVSRDNGQAITVPTLVVMGAEDGIFCTPPLCAEAGMEPTHYPQAEVEVQVIPDVGHDVNLHFGAPQWFAVAADWSLRHFTP